VEDKKIIELLFHRTEHAITLLKERFGKQLYRTAVNILGNHADAEECVSDTYLALWNVIPPKKPNPLDAFVYRTGKNIAMNRLRSNTAQMRQSNYAISLDELADCIPGTDLWEQASARELGRAIDRYLTGLNRENRCIFLRRYWFGDSCGDIAVAFGISRNAVDVRLHRLREGLRTFLMKEELYDA